MSPDVQIAIIAALPATIAAIGALVIGILNHRQSKANGRKIGHVEVQIDGRMEELVILAKQAAHGEGVAQERGEERERQSRK